MTNSKTACDDCEWQPAKTGTPCYGEPCKANEIAYARRAESMNATFPVCRGCPDYPDCQGGHPEDCENEIAMQREAAIEKQLSRGRNY